MSNSQYVLNLIQNLVKKINKDKFIAILKYNWFLFVLFIIGLVVRVVYLNDTIAISKDQVDHIRWTEEIFSNHGYIWHGARLRHGDEAIKVFLGPFYIYLLSLPSKIGGGYFFLPTILNGLLNALSIFLIYYLAKLITSNKLVGYISAILFAFSTAFIIASRTLWNPWFLPFFVLIMLISFVKLTQGKEKYLIVFVLFLSFSTQLHASVVLFIPAFMLLWYIYRIKIKHKILWLYAGLALIISYFPMVYHELKYRFENLRNLYQIIFNLDTVPKVNHVRNFLSTIKKFTESFSISLDGRAYESAWGLALWFGRYFENSFRYSAGVVFIIICLILLITIFRKKNHINWRNNLLLIPIVVIFVFLLGTNFFSSELYLYYFVAILPLAFIIIAYTLSLLDKNIIGKILVILLLIFFSYVNLSSFYEFVKARRHRAEAKASELMNPDMILKDQLDLLDFIKEDSLNQGARIEYWLNWGPVDSANAETYHYLINLKNVNVKEDNNVVYLIIDPRIKPLDDKLNGKIILLDRVFGSLRLIKYQVQ